MGKKGSWFSALKNSFIPNSKEKLDDETAKKISKEKKKRGVGKLKHGDSFIPVFREPSSIEKILEEAERENNQVRNLRPLSPPEATTVNVTIVNDATRGSVPSLRFVQRQRHECATKIQVAYRGYMARKSYKIQAVKGQNAKRQTENALKQNQIQSRRIEILYKNDGLDIAFAKYMSEHRHEWNDSAQSKEEIEGRMRRKFDAIVKRERAMSYAYSHQSWKGAPRTAEVARTGIRSGGLPYWRKWLDQGKDQDSPPLTLTNPSQSPAVKSLSQSGRVGFDHRDYPTPRSTKSSMFRDDDRLMSCLHLSIPRYMSHTQSAKAKAKARPGVFPNG